MNDITLFYYNIRYVVVDVFRHDIVKFVAFRHFKMFRVLSSVI